MQYIFGKHMNKIIHGGDYNPEQWLDRPDILQKDIEYMKQAGINEATLGVFSWSMYEPKEGEFHFEWLTQIMDNLYKNGIYTILATPSGARPFWLDKKYPEVMRVDSMGNRNHHGLRHNHCMTSPKFREKIQILDRKLAEAVGNHPGLLMWHISNEFGGECYCDLCKEKFQNHLREKFHNNIEELNHQWWTTFWSARYGSFEEIEPPYQNGQTAVMGLNLEWKRFTSQNFTDYMNVEIQTVRKYGAKNIPVTTNMMKRFWDIDYRVLAKNLDTVSWDSYPCFHNDYETYTDTMLESAFDHAFIRGLKKGKPFMLMESTPSQVNWMNVNKLKRPGVHKQFAFQAIACGSDTVQYFQFRKSRGAAEQYHGAVIDHIGTNDTRVFKEIASIGQMLEKISSVEGSIPDNKAAVLFDWENWWAIEGAGGFSRHSKKYDITCMNYWKKLKSYDVDADVISAQDSFDDYKLIIAPMLFIIRHEVAERLKSFVEKGGILLGTYISGYINENCLCYEGGFPGAGLSDLFGITNEEIDNLYPSDRNEADIQIGTKKEKWIISDFAEILRINDAEVLGKYTQDFYKGNAVLTVKKTGKGKAYYQAARCDYSKMDLFFETLLHDAQINFKKLPEGLEHHRRIGNNKVFDFYLNTSDHKIKVKNIKGKNLINEEQISGDVILLPKDNLVVTSL